MVYKSRKWQRRVYKSNGDDTIYFKSDDWKWLKRECGLRDNYCCMVEGCDVYGEGNVTTHHIVPRRSGGLNIITNLITLCIYHHNLIEEQAEIYCTRNLVQAFEEVESKKKDKEKRPKPREDCRDHPNTICWHMVVYGGISKEYLGMKIRPEEGECNANLN